ncbi:S4 domain containing protein [Trichuris trichiura]|uniref:S4 domain containing protein n=1 Tax=Trichuris trichiura TaxID=36087 RepID=A0A077Z7A0_TRITR|nr:S4 domain containing protein [Trichuris trichiura]
MATARSLLRWLRLARTLGPTIANHVAQIQPIMRADDVTKRWLHASVALRRKQKVPKKPTYEDDDDEDGDDDAEMEEEVGDADEADGSVTRCVNVKRPRLDAILKIGCNVSRNAADEIVCSGRVFVNGRRALKRSFEFIHFSVAAGDTVDIVLGPSSSNENFADVTRLLVTHVYDVPNSNRVSVRFRRWKRLTVDDIPLS